MKSVPSGADTIDHKNGADVSYTSSVTGPSVSWPWLSIERFSTSPFRKSVCVAA